MKPDKKYTQETNLIKLKKKLAVKLTSIPPETRFALKNKHHKSK